MLEYSKIRYICRVRLKEQRPFSSKDLSSSISPILAKEIVDFFDFFVDFVDFFDLIV